MYFPRRGGVVRSLIEQSYLDREYGRSKERKIVEYFKETCYERLRVHMTKFWGFLTQNT